MGKRSHKRQVRRIDERKAAHFRLRGPRANRFCISEKALTRPEATAAANWSTVDIAIAHFGNDQHIVDTAIAVRIEGSPIK